MANIIKKTNPVLVDYIIGEIQDSLGSGISWLDNVFGKVERLVKIQNGKKIYTPNIFDSDNNYIQILPDQNLGNFCFFTTDDPQRLSWEVGQTTKLKVPFSVIFWLDIRSIDDDERNTESIRQQVLKVLHGQTFLRSGRFEIEKCYEKAENVFSGFTIDEVDNQFLMQPFYGFRLAGTLTINDTCL